MLDGQINARITVSLNFNNDDLDIIRQALKTELYQRCNLGINVSQVKLLLSKINQKLKIKED